MDAVMNEYISNLNLGLVKEFKDMAVIPIFTPLNGPPYLTLKEAMKKDLLVITEVDESGSVGELKVKNLADIPVLLLDGEEIIGAKQNRVLNTTILVAEGTEVIIPVSCTEQGRWNYKSKRFRYSNVIAAHRVRRNKSCTVLNSLRTEGKYRSNQSAVWNNINEISIEANVYSKTSAMKDVYESMDSKLEEFIQAFPSEDDQKGLLVLINGEVEGLEVLSSSKSYKLLHENLVKSYAMEAILDENREPGKDSSKHASQFIQKAIGSSESRHKSVGYGCDHRFTGKDLVGSSLIFQNMVIHSAFFKVKQQN
jgi:hypothetical protein